MSDVHLVPYGVQSLVNLDLYEIDGVDLRTDASFAAGDVKVSEDEGEEANADNLPTDEGQFYSQIVSAAEATGKRATYIYVDQTGPKAWLDKTVTCETYGHPLAMHPDIGLASPDQGTAQAVAAKSITLATSAEANADYYNGMVVEIVSATTGAGQARIIESYSVARVAGFSRAWDVTPTGTIIYRVIPVPPSAVIGELIQAIPEKNPTLEQAVMALYMALRNGVAVDSTAGFAYVYNDAGTVIFKMPVTDAASVATRGKAESGP